MYRYHIWLDISYLSTTHTIYVPPKYWIFHRSIYDLPRENKSFETRDLGRGTTARRRWVGPKLRALRWNLCDIWIHLTGGRRGVSAHLYLGGLQLTFVSFLSISALYLPNVDNLSEDPWSPDWYAYGWPPHMPGCCCNRLEWAASGNWAGLCSQPDWYGEMERCFTTEMSLKCVHRHR